jgi:hypothetical protein
VQPCPPRPATVPRWLWLVMKSDCVGSAAYVATGFCFAPVLVAVSPWPQVTQVLSAVIAVCGLLLGLLGIGMATGLAVVLRAGGELPDHYWQSILKYPASSPAATSPPQPRCSRPASA